MAETKIYTPQEVVAQIAMVIKERLQKFEGQVQELKAREHKLEKHELCPLCGGPDVNGVCDCLKLQKNAVQGYAGDPMGGAAGGGGGGLGQMGGGGAMAQSEKDQHAMKDRRDNDKASKDAAKKIADSKKRDAKQGAQNPFKKAVNGEGDGGLTGVAGLGKAEMCKNCGMAHAPGEHKLKKDYGAGMSDTSSLSKKTPEGISEKTMHKLKDEYGHDKEGKSKAYATANAIANGTVNHKAEAPMAKGNSPADVAAVASANKQMGGFKSLAHSPTAMPAAGGPSLVHGAGRKPISSMGRGSAAAAGMIPTAKAEMVPNPKAGVDKDEPGTKKPKAGKEAGGDEGSGGDIEKGVKLVKAMEEAYSPSPALKARMGKKKTPAGKAPEGKGVGGKQPKGQGGGDAPKTSAPAKKTAPAKKDAPKKAAETPAKTVSAPPAQAPAKAAPTSPALAAPAPANIAPAQAPAKVSRFGPPNRSSAPGRPMNTALPGPQGGGAKMDALRGAGAADVGRMKAAAAAPLPSEDVDVSDFDKGPNRLAPFKGDDGKPDPHGGQKMFNNNYGVGSTGNPANHIDAVRSNMNLQADKKAGGVGFLRGLLAKFGSRKPGVSVQPTGKGMKPAPSVGVDQATRQLGGNNGNITRPTDSTGGVTTGPAAPAGKLTRAPMTRVRMAMPLQRSEKSALKVKAPLDKGLSGVNHSRSMLSVKKSR